MQRQQHARLGMEQRLGNAAQLGRNKKEGGQRHMEWQVEEGWKDTCTGSRWKARSDWEACGPLKLTGTTVESRREQAANQQLELTGTTVDSEAHISNRSQSGKWKRMAWMADTAN